MFQEGIDWGELVLQVMDETEKLARGQGDNWKISSCWMSLPSLAWRDRGREEVNSQMPEAGVTPNTKMATAVCAAQDRKVVRNDRGTFLPQRAGGKVGGMELRSFRPGLCYVNEPKKISVYWPLDGLFTAGWTH